MAGYITSDGFKEIREFVQTNWKYIEVKDENGNRLFVIDNTDPRISISPTGFESNPLEMNLFLRGTDSEISAGTKIGGAALLREIDLPSRVELSYLSPFEFQDPEDTLTIRISIQIPTI